MTDTAIELTPQSLELFQKAKEARDKAYANESRFQVGVALLTRSNKIYVGANIENTSYPEGWCAETTAISHMIMAAQTPEDRQITQVVVIAELDPPITPCGGCRQRLKEFGTPDTIIHAANLSGIQSSFTLGHLLPAAFRL
ncbi:MAG: cytidine deaminase [Cohaesibacter sp.]|nr:cytidine deaminase [Cohaesibacter sp.]MCV6603307.1 cytidine deaminase [Cohaesibacter sp.]